ncbi:nuclear transport factor 2 family protein [Sphingomonas sp. S6]|uniref:nuclear transport factor 2 family protein n=1 Tax=Sphingomonas sp. S6 TaxID=3368600 RepID=UPI0028E2C96E|nr:nuclear transport factor 2 family protein [uncultured Sphingomonas sp.]
MGVPIGIARHPYPLGGAQAAAANRPIGGTVPVGTAFAMTLPAIIQTYLDAYNRKDVAALVACVADSIVFEHVSGEGNGVRVEGREAFAKLAAQGAALFTTRHQAARTAVVEGDRVAIEVDWQGIPAVDLGSMAAGVPVTRRGASFLTIAEGRLIRIVDIS